MDQLKKLVKVLQKYRYAALILLLGILLMLLPNGTKTADNTCSDLQQPQQQSDLTTELEALLKQIQGVGKCKILLTEQEGALTVYHQDEHDGRFETVILTTAERAQQALISQTLPPRYRGAVVVCQGGDDPRVCLAVVEAVSSLTGLTSDRITVLKMK